MLNTQEATQRLDVVNGTIFINNTYAKVLFYSRTNVIFINHKFCDLLNIPLAKLDKTYEVAG